MSSLVRRLRKLADERLPSDPFGLAPIFNEAADEIEKLDTLLDAARRDAEEHTKIIENLRAEIGDIEAAIEEANQAVSRFNRTLGS